MKTRALAFVGMVLIAWGLKRHYSDAGAEDLTWILRPTTWLVSVVTGEEFTWHAGEGYFSRNRLFLIEKSCAGINFMIAAFGMLVIAWRHRIDGGVSALRVLSIGLLTAYSAAVVINASRIVLAMWLAAHPAAFPALTAAEVHRIEGIAVYFGGLVLLHEMARQVDRRGLRRMALPLMSYYAITIAVPLANGALRASGFGKHALVVLLVPPMAIALGCGAYWVARGLDVKPRWFNRVARVRHAGGDGITPMRSA